MKQCATYLEDSSSGNILQPLTNDKVIIITGANSGLGYYTALSLAKRNAHVLLACRNLHKCDVAKNDILHTYANASVSTMALDLSSFQSVRTFAENVKAVYSHIDVLINNAGIMAVNPREVTADGLEAQIGVNHFGHYLLTCLLFPLLEKNGRIINHSSAAHNFHASTFPYSNLQSEVHYEPWTAYGNSKVANLLFTFELNRKLARGRNPKGIMSIAVHPGYTATNLQNGKYPFWDVANSWFAMRGEDGALSQIIGKELVRTVMPMFMHQRYVYIIHRCSCGGIECRAQYEYIYRPKVPHVRHSRAYGNWGSVYQRGCGGLHVEGVSKDHRT